MTGRGRALLIIALGSLYSGLSLGGRMFYLAAIFAFLAMAFSLITVLIARKSLQFSCAARPARILRGEKALLHIAARGRLPLPISALQLNLRVGEETREAQLTLSRGAAALDLEIPARHIGEVPVGVEQAAYTDMLGLFRMRPRFPEGITPLLVLPRSFHVEPLRFFQSDEGRSQRSRNTEDLSSPEDTRAYRSGDALKRVHWKLTARKRELIVRRFETPAPPDTLVLLDCTAPQDSLRSDETASLRDTLCETALSVAEMQARSDIPVRMPLYGERAVEYASDRSGGTGALAEMLARQTFVGGTDFYRVLNLELRRLRRTGATVIITSRLNAQVTEAITHIRRMGPSARVYYITHTPGAETDAPYVARLQQDLVEVCYVTPA